MLAGGFGEKGDSGEHQPGGGGPDTEKLRQALAESAAMDNLNTHHPSSEYETFELADVLRIAQRLEIHYLEARESAEYGGD